jgi:hypothetical protein
MIASARAHRVEGFVDEGLKRAGIELAGPAADVLAARAARSRVQMLRNAGEEIRVAGLFAEHGIEPLFIKGATLAMLAHGSLSLKTSWDIDMLVAPEDVGTARRLLTSAGYRLDLPGIDDAVLIDTFIRRNMETVWVNDARGTILELHTALVETSGLLRGSGAKLPRQHVTVAKGRTLATLAPEQLFAYLCVHGTLHRWERLKWLTDVAAIFHAEKASVGSLRDIETSHGCGRAVAAALELTRLIFGISVEARCGSEPGLALPVVRLTQLSIAALQANATPESLASSTVVQLAENFRAKWLQADSLSAHLAIVGSLLDYAPTASRLRVPDWALRPHMMVWLPWRLITRRWRYRQRRGGNAASKP